MCKQIRLGRLLLLLLLLPASSLADTVKGTIRDYQTSQPIRDVLVQTLPPTQQVCTDSKGNYVIEGVQKYISYTIIAGKKGYQVNHLSFSTRKESIRVDLSLRPQTKNKYPRRCMKQSKSHFNPSPAIGGLIINWSTDTQVVNAEVYTEPPTERVRTDELGVYYIEKNVKSGNYKIISVKKDYILQNPEGHTIRVRPDGMTRCDIPMISHPSSSSVAQVSRKFNLAARQREIIELNIKAPFLIDVSADWAGTAKILSLILNGPGQRGYYSRSNGKSPLKLIYRATDKVVSEDEKWTVTVANFNTREEAQGVVHIKVTRR
jgi:hypothetical protein